MWGSLLQALLILVVLLLCLKVYIKLTTGWCRSQTCLVGKTAIVTGGNTGIGFETAIDLAKRGARVILACRDKSRADKAKKQIIEETDNVNIEVKILDLSSFNSVRKFAKEITDNEKRLDILVNNAGMAYGETLSEDKLNIVMHANYFGPFLLTNLLLGLLKNTRRSRIINVSSIGAKLGKLDLNKLTEDPGKRNSYTLSKLCNILFTIELAKKLKTTTSTTYSLHPGAVKTEIFRTLPSYMNFFFSYLSLILFKDCIEGAQTTIFLSVDKNIEGLSGEHFADCKRVERYHNVDDWSAKELWKKTEEIVNLSEAEKQY